MVQLLKHYGWLFGAVFVLLAAVIMVRLGIWQLDRLEQRRTLNARIERALNASVVALENSTPVDPAQLEFRRTVVRGVFDFSQEILLRGQALNGRPGYHVITPLRIEDSEAAVLVDRGWVPLEWERLEARRELQEPGTVEVRGIIRQSQEPFRGLGPSDPPLSAERPRLDVWSLLTIERIQQQIPYQLLPLYIERETAPAGMNLPMPDPRINLSEGPHLSYAIQWFSFATISVVGYITVYLKHRQQQAAESGLLADRAVQMDIEDGEGHTV